MSEQGATNDTPPHARVRWSYRSTSDSEYARHHDGPYVVNVQDQDGDRSVWSVAFKGDVIASGTVEDHGTKRCAFDIAMDTALAAMRAMQAEPSDDDH
jgi:hypothetical protein